MPDDLPLQASRMLGRALKSFSKYEMIERRFADMRGTLSAYDYIIANSHHLKRRYERFGVAADRMQVLYYGHDTDRLRAFRHEPRERVRFGYMGSIVKHKGIHVLAEAFDRVPEATLSVWGDHDFNDEVREYHKSMHVPDNVRFMGGYTPVEIGRVLSGIDVLILPPLWEEAYGITIDEAKLAGIPVIASRTGGISEHLAESRDGLLFEPGDVEGLIEIIRRFMSDRNLVEKYRPHGNDVISLVRHAEEVLKIYSKVRGTPKTETLPLCSTNG
jgi:glycosyltransferase involved in cell wall biosynthesis